MLDKPKFLTGVVESFDDYISSFLVALETEYLKGGENLIKFSNIPEKADVWYFYNQPFDPKMIEEYFKGWDTIFLTIEITGNKVSQYTNILIEEDLIINHTEKLFCIEDWELMLPLTLNHFISDCIRAGISLEWRE